MRGCVLTPPSLLFFTYHPTDRLLPLMQSIPSFTYDPRKQIILFPLTSHEQLVNSLQETIPLLLVESLPRHVITAAIIRQEKEERYKHKNSAAVKERDVAVDQALRVVYKIPQQVMDNLAQFQREAVHFVCDNTMYTNPVDGMPCQGNNGRALIADEMGLGKTRSAIGCIFAYVRAPSPPFSPSPVSSMYVI